MSTQLLPIDLSSAIVGTKGTIDLSNCAPTYNPAFTTNPATLQLYNESGAGLMLSFRETGGGANLPAGGWKNLAIPAGEHFVDYTVVYLLANAPVTTLLADYYGPNEEPNPSAVLGNSPIGVTTNVPLNTVATSINNVGNPDGTIVIKIGNAGGLTTAQLDNDGNLTISAQSNGSLLTVLKLLAGGGLGSFATIQMDNNQISTDGSGDMTGVRFLATDRFRWIKALGGATQTVLDFSPSGATKSWSVFYGADDSIRWNQNTDSFEAMRWSKDKSGTLSAGQITWDVSGQLHMPNYKVITGSGPGTFNHTLGTTPNIILIMPNNAAAQAWAVNTITSTQFTLAIAAAVNWSALVANVT